MELPSVSVFQSLRAVRWGVLLSLLTVLFSFWLGAMFGLAEERLKGGLKTRAEAVRDSVYQGDQAKIDYLADRGWTYYKRAHMHAGGIGTAALACSILLGLLSRTPGLLRGLVAVALGVGGLGYSLFWLLAGMKAPALGSTGAAKDSLLWLSHPMMTLLVLGLLAVLVLTAVELLRRPPRV